MVGPYRILATVGTGGMGVVYKAIDTRLNRPVAIKAIHEDAPADAIAIQHLRAEALAVAALDHPYICKIYELIETGVDTLIVMEFVEGQTLRALLRQGRLSIADAIKFGGEIAEGLANAHERGLVHRDVKPANVMVTTHGHVKLLDFGLARASVVSAPDAQTRSVTAGGAVAAGTPAYMAPEQALGEPLTAKADLFALGVVMFECLTGELPFEGASEYAYARALIQDDPKPLGRLVPDAPPELIRLIGRCLSKEPAHRPESAAALTAQLRQIAEHSSSRTAVAIPRIAGLGRITRRASWPMGIALLVVAVLLLVIFKLGRRAPSPDASQWQQLPLITWPSEESDSRSSPDGRFVSFASNRDGHVALFVQPVDGGDARLVTLPPGELVSHIWSPDGREFACLMHVSDGLYLETVAAPFGGQVRHNIRMTLDSVAPRDTRLLRWSGNAVYGQSKTGRPGLILWRVDLSQSRLVDVSTGWKTAGDLRGFDVAQDGQRVVLSMFANQQEDLWTTSLDGASLTRLTDDRFFERDPLWLDAGTVVFQSNRGGQVDLWAMTVADRRTWPLTSSQVEDVPNSVSADGSLITFQQISQNANLWVLDPATGGTGDQLTADALSDFSPTTSDDGRTIVFQRALPRSSEGVPLLDSHLMKGTFTDRGLQIDPQPVADGFSPRLSPDGRQLAYLQRPSSQASSNILRVKDLQTGATATLSEHVLPPGFTVESPFDWTSQTTAWTADGRHLLFIENSSAPMIRRFSIETHSVDATLVRAGPETWIRDLYPSSDGRALAYLAWSQATKLAALHVVDLSSSIDRVIARLPAAVRSDVQTRGWAHRDGPLIVLRHGAMNADRTYPVEIFAAGIAGAADTPRRLTGLDRAFFATARLDADRGTLYVTQSDGLIQDLYAVSLSTGALRRVSNNQSAAISFSGLVRLPDGRLVYVRDQKREDVWLIRRTEPARR